MLGLGLTVYLDIRANWLAVRSVSRQGETVQVEGKAQVAVRHFGGRRTQVVGIGQDAAAFINSEGVTVYNAFCHPRVLIGGFDAAEIVVREFLQRACGGKMPLFRFLMVIQVPNDLEGGLTDVEERALQELGLRLGAKSVTVHSQPVGQVLSV